MGGDETASRWRNVVFAFVPAISGKFIVLQCGLFVNLFPPLLPHVLIIDFSTMCFLALSLGHDSFINGLWASSWPQKIFLESSLMIYKLDSTAESKVNVRNGSIIVHEGVVVGRRKVIESRSHLVELQLIDFSVVGN